MLYRSVAVLNRDVAVLNRDPDRAAVEFPHPRHA
jgi:hypothetical protein